MVDSGGAVVSGLRRAMSRGDLTQADLARALGTSASRVSTYMTGKTVPSAALYVRALQLGDAFAAAAARGWLTPMGAVRAVRVAVGEKDRVWGLRLILQCRDHGRAALADAVGGAVEAWTVDPGSTGAEDLDALLSGLIGREFEVANQSVPSWAASAGAGGPWLFASPFFTTAEVEDATPGWLRDRGVMIAARDLVTA